MSKAPAPAPTPTDALILRTLHDRLSDRLLQEFFPDRDPGWVRRRLLTLAGEPAPAPVPAGADTPVESGSVNDCFQLYTDGASRGNPGPAGAGVVILDSRGREILARGVWLGTCTNNVAEYLALRLGLNEARRLGLRRLKVNLDSELIVRQLLGVYRVKDAKLQPLHREAVALLAGFATTEVRHVPREENRRADALANEGVDAGLAG